MEKDWNVQMGVVNVDEGSKVVFAAEGSATLMENE